jgi:hypothetical protein
LSLMCYKQDHMYICYGIERSIVSNGMEIEEKTGTKHGGSVISGKSRHFL